MFGIGPMEILVLLAFVFTLLLVIALPASIIYIIVASNKEWHVEYEGHSIILQNKVFSEKLYIDGQVVDQSGGGFNSKIRGRLDLNNDHSVIIEGRISQGFLGLTIKGRIYVDDQYLGGDPL